MALSIRTPSPPQQQQQQQQLQAANASPVSMPSTPKTAMHIDLSTLPPLIQPSPPSNTLLITNLQNAQIFHPASLQTIRSHLDASAPLFSFSPLKSFRRIVVSYYTTEAAIAARQTLDGLEIMGDRARIYFGEPTPTDLRDQHLAAPKSDKLFFISPPPSPPHDWQMRNEEPPNKEVIADDLVAALAGLQARARVPDEPAEDPRTDVEMGGMMAPLVGGEETIGEDNGAEGGRRRASTVVYRPELNGGSPGLPAVTVEDTTFDEEREEAEREAERMLGVEAEDARQERTIKAHTARPPVELMQ